MLFQTTPAHEELRAKIRQFAENEIKPIAFLLDQNNEFPDEAIRHLGEMGLMGIPYPVEYGGAGLDALSYAIAVEELVRIGVRNMIRIGSCGALQKGIRLGDLILVNGAVRDDGASVTYVDSIYPAIPDTELLAACMMSAEELGAKFHVGIARSHDSFYIDDEEAVSTYWRERGVLGSDMETAALFVIGRLRGVKTASILNTVVEWEDSLEENINSYTGGESAMMQGERMEILTALEAFVRIDKNKQGGNSYE
mgnify:CR=1 FL=1